MSEILPEASKIKIIATDIDGTLVTPEGKVSERTEKVIQKILKKYPNLHFVLASGRARPATKQICEKLQIVKRPNTEYILCNGCIIYDYNSNIVWQDTLSPELLRKVHELLKPSSECIYMYCVGDDTVLYDKEWAKILRDEYEEQTVVKDIEEYIQEIESGRVKINKLGFLISDKSIVEKYQSKLESLKKEYNLDSSYAAPIFLEYMPPKTNKGTGLTQLMNKLRVKKDEVISFGDGGNDIELFKAVGWPIAVENACDELKQYAKLITKSNAEDGVADILERIFLKDELMN
ncbi:hypothetical protein BCR36DRAFT_414192 [Piromyces finnis]|uniref:HAD-like protein n=1 Tax=Piromyces finnis TaxID=1754191 RepID=A0A1Y1V332_9FUNG|nr:hypothetical protein BCR36DRAFT_414192 [Piromyces finnis]|eukprot:ORX46204.1 hypothetical protein BCR36DRAFT_414192 [Piromyces finnis]